MASIESNAGGAITGCVIVVGTLIAARLLGRPLSDGVSALLFLAAAVTVGSACNRGLARCRRARVYTRSKR